MKMIKIEDIPSKMIGMTINALEDTLKIIDTDNYKSAVTMIKTSNIIDFIELEIQEALLMIL